MGINGSVEAHNELHGQIIVPDKIHGKSAFELALLNGFEGTETEWLESLKAEPPKFEIGTVKTFESDEKAVVELTEENGKYILHFGIPKGAGMSTLPIATTETLGGIIVGSGLELDKDGKLSVDKMRYLGEYPSFGNLLETHIPGVKRGDIIKIGTTGGTANGVDVESGDFIICVDENNSDVSDSWHVLSKPQKTAGAVDRMRFRYDIYNWQVWTDGKESTDRRDVTFSTFISVIADRPDKGEVKTGDVILAEADGGIANGIMVQTGDFVICINGSDPADATNWRVLSKPQAVATLYEKYLDGSLNGGDGVDGYSIFVFKSSNYTTDGTTYNCDQAVINTEYGRKAQVGDLILFGTTLCKVTERTDRTATCAFVMDIKGEKGDSAETVPEYVSTEADRVANVVLSHQNQNTVTFAVCTDLHYTTLSSSGLTETHITNIANSLRHCGNGMELIRKRVHIDGASILGDYLWYFGEDEADSIESIQSINEWLHNAFNGIPNFRMIGNHDLISNKLAFNTVMSFNSGAVYDAENRIVGYCYKDFTDSKIRVITLNTNETGNGSFAMSSQQVMWLETALKVPNNWATVLLSHHPLDWNGFNSDVMNVISSATGVICNIHGHTHNFNVANLGNTNIKRIAIPNACPYRSNEYGGNGNPEIGDREYGEFDDNGNVVYYNKTFNSSKDTAFCMITIDPVAKKIYADCYGAGYDREIDFVAEETTEIVNQVSISREVDSAEIYNGGLGYKDGYYVSTGEKPWEGADADFVVTGIMNYPVIESGLPSTIYIKGVTPTWAESHTRIIFLVKDDGSQGHLQGSNISNYYTIETLDDDYFKLTPIASGETSALYKYFITDGNGNAPDKAIETIKISLPGTGENLIITFDEEIDTEDEPAEEPEASYTNLLPLAIDSDGSVYNGVGYKEGYRISGSTGEVKENAGYTLTGYIAFKSGDTLRIANMKPTTTAATDEYIFVYDENFTPLGAITPPSEYNNTANVDWVLKHSYTGGVYIRIALVTSFSADTIITVNEEII